MPAEQVLPHEMAPPVTVPDPVPVGLTVSVAPGPNTYAAPASVPPAASRGAPTTIVSPETDTE